MPLTAKGKRILEVMKAEYGPKKGEEVFYASKNAGTITGVERMPRKKAKKKTTRKKTTRRKNPVAFQIAAYSPTGKRVTYYDGVSFTPKRIDSATWSNKTKAFNTAKRCGRKCVVAQTTTPASRIKAALTGKV